MTDPNKNPIITELLAKCNPIQVEGLKDQLISVDEQDKDIGPISKLDAHVIDKTTGKCPLHRAFSLFLFDLNGKLLMQQRSTEKITFPDSWTNTCCSHPNYNLKERNASLGAKHAAIRRTQYELNLTIPSIDLIHFVRRVIYSATSQNELFGEHEIDYILFCQMDIEHELNPNENEVQNYKFVNQKEVEDMLQLVSTTPWFRMIYYDFLRDNWPKSTSIEMLLVEDEIIALSESNQETIKQVVPENVYKIPSMIYNGTWKTINVMKSLVRTMFW